MKSNSSILIDNFDEQEKFYGIFLRNNRVLYNSIAKSPENIPLSPKTRKMRENRELVRLSSLNASSELKNEKIPFYKKLLIAHDSKLKAFFDFIVLILVNISSLLILYELCFDDKGAFTTKLIYIISEYLFILNIIIQFFQKYQNAETLIIESSYLKIALHYIKGWFFLDLMSIIPFELFSVNNLHIKLLRLIRLPKLIQIIDMDRMDNIISIFYSKSEETEHKYKVVIITENLRYLVRILRLVVISFIFTYILGCFWYVYCTYINGWLPEYDEKLEKENNTFIKTYLNKNQTYPEKLLLCMYFVLSTLTTVGLGDIIPQNSFEEIVAIIIMLIGVALFSYVMSSLRDQISFYNESFAGIEKGSLLQNWVLLLNQFSTAKSFDVRLISSIESHFNYFWSNDRMGIIDKNNPLLKSLSKEIKIQFINYLWRDLFTTFSSFFHYNKFRERYYKFYYEISFLLLPRNFEEEEIIYYLNEEVEEMYFIIQGGVTIGYTYEVKEEKQTKTHFSLKLGSHFGGYYTLYNVKSEYIFTAAKDTKMFGINKFDLLKLLKKYPKINKKMRKVCYNFYKDKMKSVVDASIINQTNRLGLKEYKPKEMEKIDGNWNGVTVNNILKIKIQNKEKEIKEIINVLSDKIDKLEDKRNNISDKYIKLKKSFDKQAKLFGEVKRKIYDDYFSDSS